MKPSCQVAIDEVAVVAGEKYDVLETTITTAPDVVSYLSLHFLNTFSHSMPSFLDVI